VSTRRELGRGERVLPGLWRLRLPLPWPGVPHCNAWAIAAGSGVVLVDTGMHEPGSLAQLERALEEVNLRLEHVRLVVCTHAHSDHWGQAAPICQRAGCELWLHPNHRHATAAATDPDAVLARRIEIARQSGVPAEALGRYAERHRRESRSGVARVIEPDRPLTDGVRVDSDLGTWITYETPGHSPSHVCLFQPEHRLLISGDHVLGRISLYYDYGWTPDPVGEFLSSLDRLDTLDVRLGLSGHGRPFVDVHGHIAASRQLVEQRLDALRHALARRPATAAELAPLIHDGERLTEENASWLLSETLCYLEHLLRAGQVTREVDGGAVRWRAAEPENLDTAVSRS
jgi:glyoxylase-like metal-dependent hydrolase (beta-lactamase superfamily II)